MLRASGVDVVLTREDLEETLRGHAAGRAEVEAVEPGAGSLLIRLKVAAGVQAMTVPVDLRLAVRAFRAMEVEVDVAWSNMPLVPGFLKEIVLQRAFEALPGEYRDGRFVIDLADVLEDVPVQFDLHAIEVAPAGIRVSLRNVMAFPVQPGAILIEPEGALVPVPSTEEARIPEHQGYYRKLREQVRAFAEQRAPRWAQPLVPWVLAVPDFFVLLVRLARDERVPAGLKVVVGAVIAYFIMPIDLIPDPLPLVGEIDDMAVALFALEQVAKKVPASVFQELWPGEGKVMDLIQAGVRLFRQALPERMLKSVQKILNRK